MYVIKQEELKNEARRKMIAKENEFEVIKEKNYRNQLRKINENACFYKQSAQEHNTRRSSIIDKASNFVQKF